MVDRFIKVLKAGRPFKVSGGRINKEVPKKWINGMYLHHFIYCFKYLDEQGGYFEIECDYLDKFAKLIKC